MKEAYQGRSSGRVRDFALFGETTGETDEFGLPVRLQWAGDYRGPAAVVYGHTPVAEPEWVNNTINIDTGCVFGGRLTALRWPERELVSVAAERTYYEPAKPVPPEARGRGAARVPARRRRCRRQAHRHDAARAHRDGARGERHRRARGDEPVRDRPALARLPAADDVADCDLAAPPTCWSTLTRRSPSTAPRACRRSSARRSTWARARSSSSAATPAPRATASASAAARPARSTRAPDGRSSRRAEPALTRVRARGRGRRPVGLARRRTGSRSTARCCRGRRRRWS